LDMDTVTTMNLHRKQFHITRPSGWLRDQKRGIRVLLLNFQNVRLCEYADGVLSLGYEDPVVSLQET